MQSKYVVGSIGVGVLQIIDALMILAVSGNFEDASLIPTLIEFVWVLVSFAVLLRKGPALVKKLAATFVLYNVIGWIVGAVNASEMAGKSIPLWMIYVSLVFGCAFTVLSIFVLRTGRKSSQ